MILFIYFLLHVIISNVDLCTLQHIYEMAFQLNQRYCYIEYVKRVISMCASCNSTVIFLCIIIVILFFKLFLKNYFEKSFIKFIDMHNEYFLNILLHIDIKIFY